MSKIDSGDTRQRYALSRNGLTSHRSVRSERRRSRPRDLEHLPARGRAVLGWGDSSRTLVDIGRFDTWSGQSTSLHRGVISSSNNERGSGSVSCDHELTHWGCRGKPTLLLLGLVAGAFVHDRRSALSVAAIVVVLAISWGIVVGVAAGDLEPVVGGAALGLGNLVVGALVTASIGGVVRRIGTPTTSN
jgi:hypothetical protein